MSLKVLDILVTSHFLPFMIASTEKEMRDNCTLSLKPIDSAIEKVMSKIIETAKTTLNVCIVEKE